MANSGLASLPHRWLPALDWIAGYRRDWLVPDVLAGLALWAVMVPEGMAYAGIVGVPPIMGLYTIVPALLALRCSAHRGSLSWDRTPPQA